MLQYVFNKVLILSLCSSVVFIAFTAVFGILRKIMSARLRYYLLIIPVLLCLLPVEIGLYPSYMQPAGQIVQSTKTGLQGTAEINTQAEQKQDKNVSQIQQSIKGTDKNEKVQPAPFDTYTVGRYLNVAKNILSYVWLSGIALLLLYRFFLTVKFKKTLKLIETGPDDKIQRVFQGMNVSKKIQMKCFKGVSTPFIYGIFRPVIFIPCMEVSEYELYMVLEHELTHVKRHDLIIKALAEIVNIVHFFNPIIYFLRKSVDSYCELSCDEAVTNTMDEGQCRDYGRMLLTMMKKRNAFMKSAACLSEGEKIIKKRLEIIMHGNKAGRFSFAISIALAVVLSSASIVCAGAIGSLDNSVSPKISYQGVMVDNLYITENEKDILMYIKNGTASYSGVTDHITFEVKYRAMPEALINKVDNLMNQNGYDEAQKILDNEDLYTDNYKLILSKKLRSYGDGYGLEGLFTLTKNNEIIFKNKSGYLNDLPPRQRLSKNADKTELRIEYTDNGKSNTYSAQFELETLNTKQLDKNRKLFAAMDRSRKTHYVKLGEIQEIIDNGVQIDVKALNSKLMSGRERWDNYLATIEYNTDMQLAQAVVPIGDTKHLSIWQGEKVSCDSDSIKGSFKVMDWLIKDFVPMTMSGLNNPVGGYVEIKSDDGKYYAKYKIVPDIAEPLPVKGTKEVSDFMVKGENVFVGTPSEQDDFDRDDHSILYKRIITDDYGKVIAVVPIDWQQGKNIAVTSSTEMKKENTWQSLFDSSEIFQSDKKQGRIKNRLVLQDPGSWAIKAVIPVENQFFTYIKQ